MNLRPQHKLPQHGQPPQPGQNNAQGEVKIVRLSDRALDDHLPPANTKRWVMRRKAQVVQGVRTGMLSMEDACARYGISEEEYKSWDRLISAHGVRGLRTTRLQDYRATPRPANAQSAE